MVLTRYIIYVEFMINIHFWRPHASWWCFVIYAQTLTPAPKTLRSFHQKTSTPAESTPLSYRRTGAFAASILDAESHRPHDRNHIALARQSPYTVPRAVSLLSSRRRVNFGFRLESSRFVVTALSCGDVYDPRPALRLTAFAYDGNLVKLD